MSLLSRLVAHQCYFCMQRIQTTRSDPVVLSLTTDDGAEQSIFCHGACLREYVHPDIALIFEFQDED